MSSGQDQVLVREVQLGCWSAGLKCWETPSDVPMFLLVWGVLMLLGLSEVAGAFWGCWGVVLFNVLSPMQVGRDTLTFTIVSFGLNYTLHWASK